MFKPDIVQVADAVRPSHTATGAAGAFWRLTGDIRWWEGRGTQAQVKFAVAALRSQVPDDGRSVVGFFKMKPRPARELLRGWNSDRTEGGLACVGGWRRLRRVAGSFAGWLLRRGQSRWKTTHGPSLCIGGGLQSSCHRASHPAGGHGAGLTELTGTSLGALVLCATQKRLNALPFSNKGMMGMRLPASRGTRGSAC